MRPWFTRVPLVVALFLVGAGLLGGAWLAWGNDRPPQGRQPVLHYTTERGEQSSEGTVNSPLRANLNIPWSNGSADTAVASISFQLLDDQGNPAVFGDVPGEAEAMRPALEIGVWIYDGSAPSRPGTYRASVTIDNLNGGSETFELKEPALAVKPDSGQALTGGFVFARNSNLWLLSPDATREKRLTYYSPFYEFATNPAWSPGGKAIAYAYSPKVAPEDVPYTDIWTVGPDGAGARKVVEHAGPNESLDEPAWAADGRSLYVAVATSLSDTQQVDPMGLSMESWRIDRVDLATGARSQWRKNARMPSVGANGRDVVYIERVSAPNVDLSAQGVDQLVLAGPGDAQPRVLVTEKAYQAIQAPQLSPDGKWVLFSAVNVPPSGSVISPKSKVQSPKSPGPDFGLWTLDFGLSFAPMTASAHGLPWDVFLAPSAGGNPIRLTQLNEDQPHAAWLDNSTIAVMGTTGLYKLSINAGGQPAGQPTMIHDGAPHGGLTWREEGQK